MPMLLSDSAVVDEGVEPPSLYLDIIVEQHDVVTGGRGRPRVHRL